MKNIFIIGSGGFAKEVLFLIEEINRNSDLQYNFLGFIDTSTEKFKKVGGKEYPIVEESEFINNKSFRGCSIAIGIGNPKIVKKIITLFQGTEIKLDFPNLIHHSVVGDWKSISMGNGNIFTAHCSLTVDIAIGSFNIFNLNTTIGHDTSIGDFNIFNPGVNVSGGVKIGDGNLLGTNSTILQNLTMGDNSVIGGTALLTKSLESNLVAVGVPAKPLNKSV